MICERNEDFFVSATVLSILLIFISGDKVIMAKTAPSGCFVLGWVTPQQRKGGREKLTT